MKVRFTEEALKDLDEIAGFLAEKYPAIAPAVEQRIRAVVARIARWPKSARRSAGRAGVHVAPLGRYPYKVFYRVTDQGVEILHIHQAAREPWDEDDET
ncbi:MAG: type II toxin-antitoxin system RelE/ParE family toxin [Rhodoplanes sp.]|jgi:toxin ParE1/3/4